MLRFIKEDVKLQLCNKTTMLLWTILDLLILSAFAYDYVVYRNYYIDVSRPYGEHLVLENAGGLGVSTFLILFLPLFAVFFSSLSSVYARQKNTEYYWMLRLSRKKYYFGKSISTFVLSFVGVLIPLAVNFLLCIITYNNVGFDNKFGLPAYAFYQEIDPTIFLDSTRVINPLLYHWLIIFFLCLSVATLSVFSYSISLLADYTKHTYFSIGIYIIIGLFIVSLVGNVLQLPWLNMFKIFQEGARKSLVDIWIFFGLIIASSFVCIYQGAGKYEKL